MKPRATQSGSRDLAPLYLLGKVACAQGNDLSPRPQIGEQFQKSRRAVTGLVGHASPLHFPSFPVQFSVNEMGAAATSGWTAIRKRLPSGVTSKFALPPAITWPKAKSLR